MPPDCLLPSACPPSVRVRVTFASGETREADLVIGADGINSITAKHVLGESVCVGGGGGCVCVLSWVLPMLTVMLVGEALEPAVYSGYSIFFGVIDDFDKGPALPPPPEASTLADMVDHPSAIVQVGGGAGQSRAPQRPVSQLGWIDARCCVYACVCL